MEEQGMTAVKENFLVRVTQSIKKFFFKGKLKDSISEDSKESKEEIKFKLIQSDMGFVQEEILNARKAYRKYVISNKDVSNGIFLFVKGKIQESESEIRKLIDINGNNFSFEDIFDLLREEQKSVGEFKRKNANTGRYNVPVGVIGVECDDAIDCIKNIFKAISTRNSIIILREKNFDYTTEALILLIVRECLKKFSIDSNIIQMTEKMAIDLKQLDKLIKKDDDIVGKSESNTIYIYQEDENFEPDIRSELEKLKNIEKYKPYDIQLIKGEFRDVVQFLNKNESSAVCMYTNNPQRAYKFINWVSSPNVFVNTGIQCCNHIVDNDNVYYNSKFILHKDVF